MSNMTITSVNLTKKDPNPINLTDGAAEKVAELIAAEGVEEVLALARLREAGRLLGLQLRHVLRLGVRR